MRLTTLIGFLCCCITISSIFADEPISLDGLSPLCLRLDAPRTALYIAEYTGKRIAIFDYAADQVLREIFLDAPPSGLVLSRDGNRLYVTGAVPEGIVFVIDPAEGKILNTIAVGHTPGAPVLSLDEKTLFVCDRFDADVSVVDLDQNRVVKKIPVLREPVAAVLSCEGKRLFVANHLHDGAANRAPVSAQISVIDTDAGTRIQDIVLPNGGVDLQGICVSPDSRYVFVVHVLARFSLPTTQLERGWICSNVVSVVDAQHLRCITTIPLDSADRGAANPWGIACTPDGGYLCVSHSGTHEVSLINLPALLDKIEILQGSDPENVQAVQDYSFLEGIQKRIPLKGKGPRGIAVTESNIFLADYFSDSVEWICLDRPEVHPVSLALGPEAPLSSVRKGEMLFHDGTLCFQHWQSCATCHPGGGRSDGLNWDLLNDGVGNPRNAKSLLLSHQTPPSMISGVRDSAETAVRSGIRYIQYAQCSEEEASALDDYLKSLTPVPSPFLRKGRLSPSAERGEMLFRLAGCVECHPAPLYTNLQKYNVGTGTGLEKNREFDTPSLVEIWRTAPYLHDGRAVTLEELLTRYNQEDRHGVTSKFTESEIHDLADYVRSL